MDAQRECNGIESCEIVPKSRPCDEGKEYPEETFYTKVTYYCTQIGYQYVTSHTRLHDFLYLK